MLTSRHAGGSACSVRTHSNPALSAELSKHNCTSQGTKQVYAAASLVLLWPVALSTLPVHIMLHPYQGNEHNQLTTLSISRGSGPPSGGPLHKPTRAYQMVGSHAVNCVKTVTLNHIQIFTERRQESLLGNWHVAPSVVNSDWGANVTGCAFYLTRD